MVKIKKGVMPTYIYLGFIDELYAGYMAGTMLGVGSIDIQETKLVPEFQGVKIVRIMREMIKKVQMDFSSIFVHVNND